MCVGFTTCAWKRSIIEVAADQRNSFLYLSHKSKLTTLCTYSLLINWSLDQIMKFYKVHSHILYTHTVIRNASYTLHLNQTQKNVRQWKAQNKRNSVWGAVHDVWSSTILKIYGSTPTVLFQKPFGPCVTTHLLWYLFLCTPPQIDSLVTPLSEAQNESYKKLPPCPEPSRVATLRTSSHALL